MGINYLLGVPVWLLPKYQDRLYWMGLLCSYLSGIVWHRMKDIKICGSGSFLDQYRKYIFYIRHTITPGTKPVCTYIPICRNSLQRLIHVTRRVWDIIKHIYPLTHSIYGKLEKLPTFSRKCESNYLWLLLVLQIIIRTIKNKDSIWALDMIQEMETILKLPK